MSMNFHSLISHCKPGVTFSSWFWKQSSSEEQVFSYKFSFPSPELPKFAQSALLSPPHHPPQSSDAYLPPGSILTNRVPRWSDRFPRCINVVINSCHWGIFVSWTDNLRQSSPYPHLVTCQSWFLSRSTGTDGRRRSPWILFYFSLKAFWPSTSPTAINLIYWLSHRSVHQLNSLLTFSPLISSKCSVYCFN